MNKQVQVITFNQLGKNDVDIVGGKNASLGEMISHLGGLALMCLMVLQPRQMRLTAF